MTRRDGHKARGRLLRGVLAGALACAPALLAGCNVVAPVAYLVGGPPKVPAKHELDGKRRTVVFIDDRASVVPRRSLRALIGSEVDSTLIEQKAVKAENMIASDAALRVAMDERYGDPRSIDGIGEALDAEVVIYVELVAWTMSRDGVSVSPAARLSVKVLDVANDVRLWPGTVGGQMMTVALPTSAGQGPRNRLEQNAQEESLARMTGMQIARLFFAHEEDALSGRLND